MSAEHTMILFKAILKSFQTCSVFETIWDYLGSLGTSRDHFGPFQTILDHLMHLMQLLHLVSHKPHSLINNEALAK